MSAGFFNGRTHPGAARRQAIPNRWPSPGAVLAAALLCLLAGAGCGKSQADKALDSDANGYLCNACNEKFYTDREVFASFCPKCRKVNIDQVLGFVCPADQHVTVDARGRGARGCEKCGRTTTAVSIPREAELKAWGAARKTAPEVGG